MFFETIRSFNRCAFFSLYSKCTRVVYLRNFLTFECLTHVIPFKLRINKWKLRVFDQYLSISWILSSFFSIFVISFIFISFFSFLRFYPSPLLSLNLFFFNCRLPFFLNCKYAYWCYIFWINCIKIHPNIKILFSKFTWSPTNNKIPLQTWNRKKVASKLRAFKLMFIN